MTLPMHGRPRLGTSAKLDETSNTRIILSEDGTARTRRRVRSRRGCAVRPNAPSRCARWRWVAQLRPYTNCCRMAQDCGQLRRVTTFEALFNTQAVKIGPKCPLLMCSARESAGQQSQDCGLPDHGSSEVRLRHCHQVHIPELLRLVEETLRNPASGRHGGLSLAVSDLLKFFKNSGMPGDDDRSVARLFLLVTSKPGHARHRKGS